MNIAWYVLESALVFPVLGLFIYFLVRKDAAKNGEEIRQRQANCHK